MPANPWRGETDITLNKKTYVLRPTFEALSMVEQTLGTGLVALARKLSEGAMTIEELAVILFYCLQNHELSLESIKETLIGTGLTEVLSATTAMMGFVFQGFHEGN